MILTNNPVGKRRRSVVSPAGEATRGISLVTCETSNENGLRISADQLRMIKYWNPAYHLEHREAP